MRKKNTFVLVRMLNQNCRSLSGKSWADLHDVGFSEFRNCFEFLEILDKVETRLSQIAKWNYTEYDTGNSDVRTVVTSDGGTATPR